METEPNVVDEAITHPIEKNKIDTVNETDKPQASKSKKYKSINNKSNKGRSLDKSRASQRTETEDTVKTLNKSRSILSAIFLIKVPTKKNQGNICYKIQSGSLWYAWTWSKCNE